MTPVDQTIMGVPLGDCYRACIASILDLPLDDVPNFYEDERGQTQAAIEWLSSRGLWLWIVPNNDSVMSGRLSNDDNVMPEGFCIANGPGARGCLHSVVWRHGKVVHDPSPSRAGLCEVYWYEFLIPTWD